jgi:hypothetical protein
VIRLPSTAKLVVIRLQGGLGNQMFQVALGMAIAKSNLIKVEYVRINEPLIKRGKNARRNLDVRKFSLTKDLIVENFGSIHSPRSFEKVLESRYKEKTFTVLKESDSLTKNILNCGAEVIGLDGYWQSEKYFKDAKSEILETFNSLAKDNSEYINIGRLIKQSESRSIGIHVRRGDYISNMKTNKFHGVCSIKYFKEALKYLSKSVPDPKVFIFSDDPEWARKHIVGSDGIVISGQFGLHAAEELLMLSNCSHLILSNSSFSWWGAYLRENRQFPKPSVVAPSPWFADAKYRSPQLTHWYKLNIETGIHVL